MIAEITSLIASSKTAYEIAKGINSLKSEIDRNESISKILEILLSVQTQALSVNAIAQKLQEEKVSLTQKIMEFEDWSKRKANYELKELAPDVPAYFRKKADETKDPTVWICPYCYDQKKESFLQLSSQTKDSFLYLCPVCKAKFGWIRPGVKIKIRTRTI